LRIEAQRKLLMVAIPALNVNLLHSILIFGATAGLTYGLRVSWPQPGDYRQIFGACPTKTGHFALRVSHRSPEPLPYAFIADCSGGDQEVEYPTPLPRGPANSPLGLGLFYLVAYRIENSSIFTANWSY
jgi:hypothetical protein